MMAEYIERISAVLTVRDCVPDEFRRVAEHFISILPVADVKPVVHGHWIWAEGVHVYGVDSDVQHGSVRCSACGNCSPHSTNYCPNCGARMDENENNS